MSEHAEKQNTSDPRASSKAATVTLFTKVAQEVREMDPRGDVWYRTDQLLLKSGDGLDFRIPLKSLPVVLGRGGDSDLQIIEESISKQHARLNYVGMMVMLEDLDSKNGIKHNRVKVKDAILRVGDRIQLGTCEMTVSRG